MKKPLSSISFLLTSFLSLNAYAGQIVDMRSIQDFSKPGLFSQDEMIWTHAPEKLPKGITMAVMEGDPNQAGPFTIRLKIPENYEIPAHWNYGDEHITVIEGGLFLGMGDKLDKSKGKMLPIGAFARIPSKMHHFSWTTKETIIQLHGQGPWGITYVNPIEDPSELLQLSDKPGTANTTQDYED